MTKQKLVKTSYSDDDVTVLLQDVEGKVPVLDTHEREKLNQQGVHYSEMLPLEYEPSETYMNIYNDALERYNKKTANAVAVLAHKIYKQKGETITLVSLARAGTPIGILLKRFFKKIYNIDTPHYTISIIRGKGIDKAAMNYILDKHTAESIVFVDGWVGKGAINNVLRESVLDLNVNGLSSELAVLSDPASETNLYGTREDFLIPSSCLNSTVSGLISRTVHLQTMNPNEYHGAVYYKTNEPVDLSNDFITKIESYFIDLDVINEKETDDTLKGIQEVNEIAQKFGITDINKVKPGIGETIRVLLRRVPHKILISETASEDVLLPIIQLAKEKEVPIETYPLQKYNACGIIKNVADL